jgi:hypothetical protein
MIGRCRGIETTMPNELWGVREAACAVRTGHRFLNGFCLDCEAPDRKGYWSSTPMLKIFADLLACEQNVAKLLGDLAMAERIARRLSKTRSVSVTPAKSGRRSSTS